MKKLKDVDLNTVPTPVSDPLRTIIPGDADVDCDFSDPHFGVISAVVGDDVKDDCSNIECDN